MTEQTSTPMDRIAAAADENGWTTATPTEGTHIYDRMFRRVAVTYGSDGSVLLADRIGFRGVAYPVTGTGTEQLERVLRALS